ncbi:MAG: type VI secretion system baseplate subunit TssF [Desulfobacterales bacterium]
MFNSYYQQELSRLKEIAGEFAKQNPAIAPMLGETASDPDVERLVESVAFLTGLIRERIDDEFPEIIHNFIRQIWPHYLRPVPSATIIAFSPLEEGVTQTVAAGAYVDSIPVDGTRCTFRTCYDVHVHPVKITGAQYREPAGNKPSIRLTLRLIGITAEQWSAESIRLYLAGGLKNAGDLYYVLSNHLNRVVIRDPKDQALGLLDKTCLRPVGVSDAEALLPYPSNSFTGYRLLQEYFFMPEKFFFLDLSGWENWTERSGITEFHVDFELKSAPDIGHFKVDSESFALFATPAVNIFPHSAVPVEVDHRKTEYVIRPAGDDPEKYQVYSIEDVSGVVKGLEKDQKFESFHSFNTSAESFMYNEKLSRSPVYDKIDFRASLAYPPGLNTWDLESLSFYILCTNANTPEALGPGDICVSTFSIPESLTFANLTSPTTAVLPPLGTNMLWRLVSLLTINSSSLSRLENLKALLKLHLMKEGSRDIKRVQANEKRIDGIRELETKNIERLVKATMMQGLEIRMKISQSHFAGPGDLYLFGVIIDHFLGLYASMNNFTKLVINETDTGEIFSWPERIGTRQII